MLTINPLLGREYKIICVLLLLLFIDLGHIASKLILQYCNSFTKITVQYG